MYEHASFPHPQTPSAQDGEPAVIWLEPAAASAPLLPPTPVMEETTTAQEADPYDVINFLLKKVEEQQGRLDEQEGYAELLSQEVDQLRGQIEVTRQELDMQLADYEVLMQNTLAVEHELEEFKSKAIAKPTIKLPFHTGQKLANLGYAEPVDLVASSGFPTAVGM